MSLVTYFCLELVQLAIFRFCVFTMCCNCRETVPKISIQSRFKILYIIKELIKILNITTVGTLSGKAHSQTFSLQTKLRKQYLVKGPVYEF